MSSLWIMRDTLRTIEDDGENLGVKLLPEIKDRVAREARRRAKEYGARDGELRSTGTYLAPVALLHFLRLSAAERKAIYAEMRAVIDQRLRVDEDSPFELPPYPSSTVEAAKLDAINSLASPAAEPVATAPKKRRRAAQ